MTYVIMIYLCSVIEMAEAIPQFDPDRKMKELTNEVRRVFDELYHYLADRRAFLMNRLNKIRDDYGTNSDLANAIKEIVKLKDELRRNLIASVGEAFDEKIRVYKNSKVYTENLEFIGFRCHSEKIRKAINEIDLYELCPEYVGKEKPVLTTCNQGRNDGELLNPAGIVLDRARNEVYVGDYGNGRIQILSTSGDYVRQFGRDYLTQPLAICISQQEELFVTDSANQCVLKFSLTGEFLKQAGSRGNTSGQFIGIRGICCEVGLVYICDCTVQRIQIFDSDLNYINYFGYGELSYPTNIHILSDTIYILPQNMNCIYCYNRDCTLQKKIELIGQEQLMTAAFFFTIDKRGNFLITDLTLEQILIFSSEGVLSHILGRRQLPFIAGITLDNFDRIICVCNSKECFIKF